MNNNEEVKKAQDDIEAAKALLDDAQKRLERLEKKEPERWRAKHGEMYYIVSGDGRSCSLFDLYGPTSDEHWKIGNYYRTKEEAEAFAEVFRNMIKTPPDYKMGEGVEYRSKDGSWDWWGGWSGSPIETALHYMGLLRRRQ